jgi:hypothetical protein
VGYGPAQSRLLREQARSTPDAREFAVERGWNEERRGAWAIELALPAPLSSVLAALEPTIREDSCVIGYGGRTLHRSLSGSLRQLLPPPFGAAASHSVDQIPPPLALASSLSPRPESGGSEARIEGVDPANGRAAPRQSEILRERVSAVMEQSRSLCQSMATAVRQTCALRSQLAGTGGEWHSMVSEIPAFMEKRSAGGQWPAGAPGQTRDVEPWLPDAEFAALNEVVTHAHDLAAAGCLSAGYTVLLAGRHRAEHAAAAGVDWAPNLIGIYSLALENYIWRYGVKP